MDLNEVAIFVKVVEAGSFARAAKSLEMPKSTVSAKVSSLERRLGVTLIRRTTRQLHVTDAGQTYYKDCLQAIGQIARADEMVTQTQARPNGLLRLTAPVELGTTLLPDVIVEFNKRYPDVELELLLSDQTMDLIGEGVDLAIRAGELKDSSLISKKLGAVHFATFASPRYLKKRGRPKSPQDLKDHRCIGFLPMGSKEWRLIGPKGAQTVRLNQHITTNDLDLVKSLALSGMGVALLPTFLCQYELQGDRLVRILGEWRSNLNPVHFVYAPQKFIPPKMTTFVSVATEMIRQRLMESRS